MQDGAFACGSTSTSRTRRSHAAREAARLIAVVVFPTPPFWFASEMILAMVFHVEHLQHYQVVRISPGEPKRRFVLQPIHNRHVLIALKERDTASGFQPG